MKKILLYGTLGILLTFLVLSTIKGLEYKKLRHEHRIAKSELNQIYKTVLLYLHDDDENAVMPAYADFHSLIGDPYFKPWIVENHKDEVRLLYKPGVKLSDVDPKDKLISFRSIYVTWDGTVSGEFKRPE